LYATRNLKSAGESGHYVPITLSVKLDLPGFVLHQLRLVAALNGAQFLSRPPGKESSGKGQGQESDKQKDSEDYV
jgi:hypothetical protein